MTKISKTRTASKPIVPPDAVAFLDDVFGHEADWSALVEQARANRDVAHAIYDLRTAHGLTQHELANRIGSTQPVIARLEDADYTGHSLTMLSRIAAALNQRVDVKFVPLETTAEATPQRLATTGGRGGVRTAASAAGAGLRKAAQRRGNRPVKAAARSIGKATSKSRPTGKRRAAKRDLAAK